MRRAERPASPPPPPPTRTALGARLATLGQRSPVWTALAYALPVVVGNLLLSGGVAGPRRALALLGVLLWLLAGLWLVLVVAWYRDDDTVGAGVICGFTVVVVGVAVQVARTMIAGRSIGAGLLLFMSALLPSAIAALFAVAICIGLVWVARELAPGFGVALASEARSARRAA